MDSTPADYLKSLDEPTAALFLRLHLEDIESIQASSKDKTREGEIRDEGLALQLYEKDLETSARTISDRNMARSIAQAIQTDGYVLEKTLEEEEHVRTDRSIAQRMTSGEDSWETTGKGTEKRNNDMNGEILANLSALYVSEADGVKLLTENNDFAQGESSSTAGRESTQRTIDRRCVACREEKKFFDVARVPCGHEYCRECLDDLFRASLTDETLFPPSCCRQPIPLHRVRMFLSSKTGQEDSERKIEFETSDRTYCSAKTYSAFIPPENIRNEIATCNKCGMKTCAGCNAQAHAGDCPNDQALQELLETATENGWQRCYSCWRVVELAIGCNHMTFVP